MQSLKVSDVDNRLLFYPDAINSFLPLISVCAQYDDHYPEGYNNNYNVDYDDDDQDTHLWTFLGKNVVFWVLYGIFVLLAGVVPLAFFLLLLAARIINCTTEQAKSRTEFCLF